MDHKEYLRKTFELASEAREKGNTPFGAILVSKDGEILLKQGNIEIDTHDATAHAERVLASLSSQKYSKEFLNDCTLYTNFEPCAMCSGAIYWAGIGTVVYGLDEVELLKLTGDDLKNPTMSLDCRKVLNSGQREIKVIGPFNDLYDECVESHKGYWKK